MTKGRRGWNLHGLHNSKVSGDQHSSWKGDAARRETKHKRARRLYPVLGKCENCGKVAVERHHKDGNAGNNKPENVMMVCRRCHMTLDGRLTEFASHSASGLGPQDPKLCTNCRRLSKPLRKGRAWLVGYGLVCLEAGMLAGALIVLAADALQALARLALAAIR